MTNAALKEPTRREENFIQVYDETGNASEAYREAYSTDNMKPNTVRRAAHKVLHRNHVQATLAAKKAEREQDQKELTEKAKEHADRALQIAVDLMEDTKEAGSTRLGALREVLDRGHGRSISKTELEANLNMKDPKRPVDEWTDDELEAALIKERPGEFMEFLKGKVASVEEDDQLH